MKYYEGVVFSRLTVVAEEPYKVTAKGIKKRYFRCACSCGGYITTSLYCLKLGITKSCGCLRVEMLKKRGNSKGICDGGLTRQRGFSKWNAMMMRCYNIKYQSKRPAYIGCTVCDEWKYFSNFKKWFDENYVEGYHLDKDILVKGNKVYSPDTCCFVPSAINSLFTKRDKGRGKYPIGVYRCGDVFTASCRTMGTSRHLGSFKTKDMAFLAYKKAKEAYIKEVADEYYNRHEISKRVYDAMYQYEVSIND